MGTAQPHGILSMSLLKAGMRRILWATVVEMAVQASLDSAMPPRVSLDEFDTAPPSNINNDEIDEWTTESEPHPKKSYTSVSPQLILAWFSAFYAQDPSSSERLIFHIVVPRCGRTKLRDHGRMPRIWRILSKTCGLWADFFSLKHA